MFREFFIDSGYTELLENLGEWVTVESGGESRQILALFEREYFAQDLGAVVLENRNPTIRYKESEGLGYGDVIEFNCERFEINSLQPDGRGIITAELQAIYADT